MKIVNNKKEIISEAYPQHTSDSLLIVVSRELDRISTQFKSTTYTLYAWSVCHITK